MIQHYPEESLDWSALSANPYAINLLRAHPHKIDWEALAVNPEAYELIVEGLAEKRVNYWGCLYLLEGLHSERLLKESSHLFQESVLSSKRFERESITVTQMCSRPDQIENVKVLDPSSWSIYGLAENTHPEAADLIERWLEIHQGDEDVVAALCGSRNERVLEMVEERYPELVDGSELSLNPQAIDMLLRNREWVRWDSLANNPSNRVMEVVKKYIHSFNASTFRVGMYKRLEILEVDKEKYQKRIKSLVKKLL
jgi:hypothetical protein